MIKVSVIIPTYGKPIYLKQCIESVINQSITDWELIIVDDNNPKTPERVATEILVSKYLNRGNIRYIKHDCNKNGAVARNTGFVEAKGKYIALLDSDDEYKPERFSCCCEILDKADENVAGVYTGCEYRKGGKVFNIANGAKTGNFLVDTLACKFHLYTGSNIFVRKCVVDELNGFDPTFLRHQDYEFMVRLFEKYSLIGIPKVLVIKNNENHNLPEINKLVAIKKQYLTKYNRIIQKLSKEKRNYIYLWNNIDLAENAMGQGEYKLANKYYKEAAKYGNLPAKTIFRRVVFPLYNLIIRKNNIL